MNGPVVFSDLSHVPKDYRDGRRIPSYHLGNQSGSGSGYLSLTGTRF
ncbi:unnamed protein product, partial [Staurois parvus]